MTNKTTTPATKEQLDVLIERCLDAGYNEAAGLLKLGSETISEKVKKELTGKCICLEIIGDNGDCPVHGKGLEQAKADYFDDYGADYQERNDLYCMGMGC